jgi:hypothetical protein
LLNATSIFRILARDCVKCADLFPHFYISAQKRETFFYCALCVNNKVTSSPVADFLVDGHTFEVGGKSKKQKQIKGTEDAFVVKDDIENAYLNILPLWSFGFNY